MTNPTLTGRTVTLADVPAGDGNTHPTFTTEVLCTNFYGPGIDSIEVAVPNHGRRVVWVGYVIDIS